MSSMIISDVNYDNFSLLSVYVIYILSLNYSGTDTPKRKTTVQSQQKLKRLIVRLSGGVLFEKDMSNKDSSFVPREKDKDEGVSVSVMKI